MEILDELKERLKVKKQALTNNKNSFALKSSRSVEMSIRLIENDIKILQTRITEIENGED